MPWSGTCCFSRCFNKRSGKAGPMKKLCASVIAIVVVSLGGLASGKAQQRDGTAGWTTFSVPQFGTRVAFPATIFSVPEGKSQKGIGQRFRTSDGRAIFSIYSTANDAGETPAAYLRNNLRRPRSALQYQRVTSSFFAISEETREKVYYSRCNFSTAGAIHCFDLEYPRREKRAWDAIVTRISRSLRPLHG
jgi:hypothetical protein